MSWLAVLLCLVGSWVGGAAAGPEPSVDAIVETAPLCYEDEVIVLVVAEVAPDDGNPGIRWTDEGKIVGQYHCVPADDLTAGFRPDIER